MATLSRKSAAPVKSKILISNTIEIPKGKAVSTSVETGGLSKVNTEEGKIKERDGLSVNDIIALEGEVIEINDIRCSTCGKTIGNKVDQFQEIYQEYNSQYKKHYVNKYNEGLRDITETSFTPSRRYELRKEARNYAKNKMRANDLTTENIFTKIGLKRLCCKGNFQYPALFYNKATTEDRKRAIKEISKVEVTNYETRNINGKKEDKIKLSREDKKEVKAGRKYDCGMGFTVDILKGVIRSKIEKNKNNLKYEGKKNIDITDLVEPSLLDNITFSTGEHSNVQTKRVEVDAVDISSLRSIISGVYADKIHQELLR